jgi:hypothetical protein
LTAGTRVEAIEAVYRNRDHPHQRPALLGDVALEQPSEARIQSKQPLIKQRADLIGGRKQCGE